jgi:hypothetical protein
VSIGPRLKDSSGQAALAAAREEVSVAYRSVALGGFADMTF